MMPTDLRQLTPSPAVHGVRNHKAVLRRERAIVALLECRTVGQAATQADVGERTLQRWLAEPSFQQDYREAQRRLLDGALNTLHRHAADFADVIARAAGDESVPMAIRLGAAVKGLEVLMRIHDRADLEYQLNQLEETVSQLTMEAR
jgi:hypothetical protein